ncbi:MAG: phosphatidylglycerophosphatase A [Synergistaceae bacterium]|jgi:phosphatidylglycerophosphatase A|nr:phosphatidylglycerophosphatase A [Synergistaceae bacterium]
MKEPLSKWYGVAATVFGVGMFPQMPGTAGTAVAMVIYLLTGESNILLILSVTALGVISADRYAKAIGAEDPGEVVIDEVAGYFVSVWGLGLRFALVAFFLFRVVDIIKPFPVRNMEKLPGGFGIMADDICGGIIVNVLLRFLEWFFFSGGFAAVFKFLGMEV